MSEKLIGSCIFGQSGGPTAVINASAYGVIRAALDAEEITKVYEKGSRRLRYNQNVLLAAAYSWILVERNEIDAAFKALNHALENSDDQTLKANREHLANNRVAHFSNTAIGDQWYALLLEEPKVHQQRPRMQWR